MEDSFWLERWRTNDIGFNLPKPHAALAEHWPRLGVAAGSTVLVPLAGKSIDMAWLAEHGHGVIGVELSPEAVAGFFHERSRAPGTTSEYGFQVSRAGPFELWCGDFFAMPETATRRIGAVYDRAALVAMPHVMQARYVQKLAQLTPPDVPVLLIALDYDPSEMSGPPFSLPQQRIEVLTHGLFSVEFVATIDGLLASPRLKDRGLSRLTETVCILRRTRQSVGTHV